MHPTAPLHSSLSAGFPSRYNISADVLLAYDRLEKALSLLTGLRARPTPDRCWAKFAELSTKSRVEILEFWKQQAAFIEGAIEQGVDAYDECSMLRYAAGRLNLLGDSSLFDRVGKEDVVEILNSDYVQVYRSYSCFSLCNYSLLELAAYPFFELYGRSSNVLEQLLEASEPFFQGKSGWMDLSHLPEYTLRELMTEEGGVFLMREKFFGKVVSSITGQNYVLSVKQVTALGEFALQHI